MTNPTFDSDEWRLLRDEKLRLWLLGDEQAMQCLLMLFHLAELWDDVVDGQLDPAVGASRLAWGALCELPSNPFYQRHITFLTPVVQAGANAWMDSVQLEGRDDLHSQVWAYALRDFYMELVPLAAYLVGGFDHMRRVSLEARNFFQAETLADFIGDRS